MSHTESWEPLEIRSTATAAEEEVVEEGVPTARGGAAETMLMPSPPLDAASARRRTMATASGKSVVGCLPWRSVSHLPRCRRDTAEIPPRWTRRARSSRAVRSMLAVAKGT